MLRKYQSSTVTKIANSEQQKWLLHIDTRLGKSVISLSAVNQLNVKTVCIVFPAFLRSNWAKEVKKWLDPNIKDISISYHYMLRNPIPKADYYIFDESHFARTYSRRKNKNKWTKIVMDTMKNNNFMALTATPTISGIVDWFPLCYGLGLVPLKLLEFKTKYAKVRYSPHVFSGIEYYGVNERAETELKDKLRPYVIRIKKKNVWKELPRRSVDVIKLKKPNLKLDKDILVEFLKNLKEGKVKQTKEIKSARVELGLGKVNQSVKFIQGISGKSVVFCYHRDVAIAINKKLGDKSILVMGGDRKRDEKIKEFTEGKKKFLVCTIKSTNVGVDLKEADQAIFVELPYTPADLEQAESRIENITRVKPLNIYHLVTDHKLDTRLLEILQAKQDAVDAMDYK